MTHPSPESKDAATDAYRDALAFLRAYRDNDTPGQNAILRNCGTAFPHAQAALASLLVTTLAESWNRNTDGLIAWLTEQVLAQ